MDADRTTMMGGAAPAGSEEQCPACEATIPAGDDFCPRCGYQRGTWQGGGAVASAAETVAPSAITTSQAGPALWTLSADGQSWPLAAGNHVIGRGEVEIRIDDGYASRRHAQLEVSAERVSLTDLGSSNGTFIGERRLEPNAAEEVEEGSEFRVANTRLRLQRAVSDATLLASGPTEEPAAPEGTQVMDADSQLAQQTDSEGTTIDETAQLTEDQPVQERFAPSASHWELRRDTETIEVVTGEMTLGRKDTATRIIEGDSYISGCHCRLIASEDSLEIIDLHSTNGTYVNDARLDPEQPWKLQTGDKLRIGQSTFEVVDAKPAMTEGQELEQREPSE